MKTIESEAFRIAEQLYVRPFDDEELKRECQSVGRELGVSWQKVWHEVRCAYNSTFVSSHN